MKPVKSLHTLNARDNVMLEVMRDYFELSPEHLFPQIQAMRHKIEQVLSKKGISYDKLRSALVPSQNRREIALVFDRTKIDNNWYGYQVMARVIPLFDKRGNHSVLVGDYLGRSGLEDRQFTAFERAVELRHDVDYLDPNQFYIVYINNLTDAMVERFDKGLLDYEAYAGIADTTYASTFKVFLSTMLVNSFIKQVNIILQGDAPDCDPDEDVNVSGYPFEENGYTCRSMSDDLMGVLLSYKIERPVFPGFEADTEFALNAVGSKPQPLDDFDIEVDEAKLGYIKREKTNSIARAGLQEVTSAELAEIIRGKISGSYVYNISVNEGHNVTKFNIIIELPPTEDRPATRLLASLEYQPGRKSLRLITLF